ncbi:branched-chain amino acid ABC transporter substrate-binding protein [Streptomyces sp. NPDC058052]|uniref:branched-chain amino acid ABC transporter substrate-binding protein n=1 Tax=Streptomyces sp. NPDC058052 TaxID=3346316 RepID=UPI0036EB31A7
MFWLFRTIGTDDQGPFSARYLHEGGKTKLYVVDDASGHGIALASGLTAEWKKLGGAVVGTEQVDPDERSFAGLAVRVRSSGAEAVYFGGYYDTAARVSQQLEQAGVTIPLMGGDGLFGQQYLTGNPQADGDLATQLGAPATESAAGRDFLTRYGAAGYSQPPGWYGPYAYDATLALIEAVKAVAEAEDGTLSAGVRAKLPGAVEQPAVDGVTDGVAFDGGDIADRRLTVYRVDGGSRRAVTTGPSTP